jgi:hypothetical protein
MLIYEQRRQLHLKFLELFVPRFLPRFRDALGSIGIVTESTTHGLYRNILSTHSFRLRRPPQAASANSRSSMLRRSLISSEIVPLFVGHAFAFLILLRWLPHCRRPCSGLVTPLGQRRESLRRVHRRQAGRLVGGFNPTLCLALPSAWRFAIAPTFQCCAASQ